MQESRTRNLGNTQVLIADHIKVYIERHCWQKMYGWCKAAQGEVSGMGLVKIEDGRFHVYEVFLPKQYGSSGYTELDDIANAKLQQRIFKAGKDLTHFRFWWHTHYNFDVFWSGTDDDNAKEQMRANGEWELSLVINQRGEYRCRADFMTNVHPLLNYPQHYLVDNLKVFLTDNSRRVRKKKNYKGDIRRWVRPLSELPESQKPKPVVIIPPTPPERTGYEGDWWERQQEEMWKEYRKEKADKDDTRPHWMRERDEIREREKKGPIKNGDKFGHFVFWNGTLISPEIYKRISGGEIVRPEGEHSDSEVEHKDICPCGDEKCSEGQMCIPCTVCGGRFQSKNGYCPGCKKLEKESEPVCQCPHDGNWENCACSKDCYKCVEEEYHQYMM